MSTLITDVYDENGNKLAEQARIRAVKIAQGVYTTELASSSQHDEERAQEDAYGIIRAETSSGNAGISRYTIAGLAIPWVVKSANDLWVSAYAADGRMMDGVPSTLTFYDQQARTLTIPALFGDVDFVVFVSRAERPENELSITADGRVSASAVLAQFDKDNRVLKQFFEARGLNLRTPDGVAPLPEAGKRAGRVLAFDAQGNPDVGLKREDVGGAYTARDEAAAKAGEARASAAAAAVNAATAQVQAATAGANAELAEQARLAAVVAKSQAQGALAQAQEILAAMQAVYDTNGNRLSETVVPRIIKVSEGLYTLSFQKNA